MFFRTILTAGAIGLLSTASYAGCGIDSGSVRIGGNDFPAYQAVTEAAAGCSGGGVSVTVDLNKDHKAVWLEGADHFENSLFFRHKLEFYYEVEKYLKNDCFKNTKELAER